MGSQKRRSGANRRAGAKAGKRCEPGRAPPDAMYDDGRFTKGRQALRARAGAAKPAAANRVKSRWE